MFHYSTCLSESDVTKFSDIIPTLLTSSILCTNTAQSSYLISTSTEVNYLVNNVKTILCMTMNTVASLLENASNQNYLPPWCNFQIYTLKQITCKLERKWNLTNLEDHDLAWKKSLLLHEKALRKARTSQYSSMIEENTNNLFLFSAVAWLTKQ